MAVSGVVAYSEARDQIIEDAFAHINVYEPGESIDGADAIYAERRLNGMIKQWETTGLYLWKKTEATLFLALGQVEYTLDSDGDNATNSYVETALSVDAISGATSLTVDSTSDMTIGDYIGIVLDSGVLYWTTIATIPDSTTLTLTDGLSGDAAEDNAVFSYTTKIDRPLQVFSCRRNSAADQDTPMFLYSYQDYFDLPNKTTVGIPTSFTYNPQRDTGLLYIWPSPQLTTDKIKFTYARPFQIFTTANDDPDFPVEWIEVLSWQLAVRIAPRFGRANQIDKIKAMADDMLQANREWDNEYASVFLQPERRY